MPLIALEVKRTIGAFQQPAVISLHNAGEADVLSSFERIFQWQYRFSLRNSADNKYILVSEEASAFNRENVLRECPVQLAFNGHNLAVIVFRILLESFQRHDDRRIATIWVTHCQGLSAVAQT